MDIDTYTCCQAQQGNCHYLFFINSGLSRLGFKHTTFRMLGERSNCATAVAIMFEFCVEMTRKEVTVQTIGDNHAEIGGGIPPPTFGKFLPVKSFNLSFFTSNTMGFFYLLI